jgi:hypothetical protein
MLNVLLPILFTLNPGDPIKVHVSENDTKIESRSVNFGVKETVEELLSNQGYTPVDDTAIGIDVWVSVDTFYSPQQILNIFGTKWLRKDYVVTTSICIGGGCFEGVGERRTFIFAMFLDVENNEVPLNRKAFSKALETSLKETVKFKTTKQQ